MRIVVDAMGGDNAPSAQIEAVVEAAHEYDAEFILVGKEDVINKELSKYTVNGKVSVVNASEVIEMAEEPVKAIKTKKDSSIAVAARMLKNKEADAMLSCGSTGAVLVAALLIVGRVKGVSRPAIATFLPGEKGPVMLTDMGANTNCKAANLVQFALMGNTYLKNVCKIKEPRIALMSNGTEPEKGDALTKEAHKLFKEQDFNFIGNVEGRDVMLGDADLIVCDGFVGNVILKTVEGMGKLIGNKLKSIFSGNIFSVLSALLVYKKIKAFKKRMDYREYGGAPLLGVLAPMVKGHGSSDKKAVMSAIRQTIEFASTDFAGILESELKKSGIE